jgi:hypothetical protein
MLETLLLYSSDHASMWWLGVEQQSMLSCGVPGLLLLPFIELNLFDGADAALVKFIMFVVALRWLQ